MPHISPNSLIFMQFVAKIMPIIPCCEYLYNGVVDIRKSGTVVGGLAQKIF